MAIENIIEVDITSFLTDRNSEEAKRACHLVAKSFIQSGALILRNPRVNPEDNDRFLDMMEKYFAQDDEDLLPDARPDLSYQVGVTPEGIEVPRCASDPDCEEAIKKMEPENRPHEIKGSDPKMRFFWRMGDRPAKTNFAELNAAPVLPKAFPQWSTVMNGWGQTLHENVRLASEMLAVGLGLPPQTFLELTRNGPHLLAPTGTRLDKWGTLGKVYAGFHTDLNFITIHGQSRFPGLYIWPRTGEKIQVKVPFGCLLLQAGKQLEWITGGLIRAGFHEVVCTERTLAAIAKRKEERPDDERIVRVSSTLFFHVASDNSLAPLFDRITYPADDEIESNLLASAEPGKYPDVLAGEQVAAELAFISLGKK